MEDFVKRTSASLPDRVREALWARGATDEQMTLFQIGHLDGLLPEGNYPQSFLRWCGVEGRLDDVYILPLTNVLGHVRGLQFRHVERAGTFGKSPYLDFIEINDEAIFFGLGQAAETMWSEQRVWLVEGAFDLFPIQRVFPGTVSTLTARVTDPLLRLLRRLVTRVWLGYDMDLPGRRACEKYKKQLDAEFDVRIVNYPKEKMVSSGKVVKDPGDLWETWGDARFQKFVKSLVGNHKEPFDA
jgi:DNA primase